MSGIQNTEYRKRRKMKIGEKGRVVGKKQGSRLILNNFEGIKRHR